MRTVFSAMRMRTRRTPIVVARRAGRQMAGKLACYSITPERVVTPKMQCDELRLEPGDTLCKLIRWEEVRKNPIAAHGSDWKKVRTGTSTVCSPQKLNRTS